jgi:hypothetical protein
MAAVKPGGPGRDQRRKRALAHQRVHLCHIVDAKMIELVHGAYVVSSFGGHSLIRIPVVSIGSLSADPWGIPGNAGDIRGHSEISQSRSFKLQVRRAAKGAKSGNSDWPASGRCRDGKGDPAASPGRHGQQQV